MSFQAVGDVAESYVEQQAAVYRRRALVSHLAAALSVVEPDDRGVVAELLVGWLEEISAGAPRWYPFSHIRDDAEWWADMATPAEIEAFVGAGLRRIERTQFAQAARKRIFVALWESMNDADRRRFVQRVDPAGRFQKAE